MKSLDIRIIEARRNLNAARDAFNDALLVVQADCPHNIAAHRDGYSDMLGRMDGIRICLRCGLEEKDRWGSTTLWTGQLKDAALIFPQDIYECRP